jgi:PAS domain S-box-containing protein
MKNNDKLKADAKVLGQILAAQNILFVLPSEKQITEFFAKSLSTIPGVSSCCVCIGTSYSQEGELNDETCKECLNLRIEKDIQSYISKEFICRLNKLPDLFIYPLETIDNRYGFIIFLIDETSNFELYKPFICNLGNFIALTLENRIQKSDLQKSHDVLESKVEQRTIELQKINITLEKELVEHKHTQQLLANQFRLLSALINSSGNIIIFSLDRNYCYTAFNEKHREEMKQIWNIDIQIGMNLMNCISINELKELAKHSIDRALGGETFSEIQYQIDAEIYYEFFWNPIYQNNEVVGITAFVQDITSRKKNEDQILKLNKIYAVLSNINQSIVRIHNKKELLNEVCHIAVVYGNFRMVWIGLIDQLSNKVEVVASNGFTGDYLKTINLDLNDESLSSGPTGQAIKSGKYKISNNIESDESMIYWRDNAIKYGFKSTASFPLVVFNNIIGALSIYSDEPSFFKEEDINLLNEMTLDISFALEYIETENHRKDAELALFKKSEELERYFTNTLDLLCIADTDGYFQRLNPQWESTLGFSLKELERKRFLDLVHPDDMESTLHAIAMLEKQEEILRFTNRYLCKDGSYKWIEWNSFPSGKLIYAVARNITEHKLVEQERYENLLFYESLDLVNRAMQQTDNLELMMRNTLRTIMSIFDSDRVWLFYPCDPDVPTFRVPMEVTKPDYPGAKILNIEIPLSYDMAENLREVLNSDGPVTYLMGTERPINKISAEQFNVKSMMMVALYPKSDKPWALGLHQCSIPRTWTNFELRLFKEISRRISDVLTSLLAYNNLRESEAKYRRIVDTANEGIWMISQDGITITINTRMADMLGYNEKEIIGKPYTDFMFNEDIDDHQFKMMSRRNGIPGNYERRFKRKDGVTLWTQVSAAPIFNEEQKFIGSFAMFTDTTERKRNEAINSTRLYLLQYAASHSLDELLEETLNEAEKLTNSCIGFYHFVEDNQKFLTLQNWSKRTKKEFCKAEGKGLHYAIDEAGVWVDCVSQGKPVIHNDYSALAHRKGMPEGHAKVIRELVVPVLRGNKIKAILGIGNKTSDYNEKDIETISILADLAWEIAEKKRSEEALRQSEEKFRRIAENARDVIYRMSLPDGKYEYMSPAVLSMFGYSSEEYYKDPLLFKQAIHPNWQKYFEEQWINLNKGEMPPTYEYQIIHKSGEERWLNQRNILIKDKAGNPIAIEGIVTDITERKQAEEAIRKREQEFHSLAENSPDNIMRYDINCRVIYANSQPETDMGFYDESVFMGKTPLESNPDGLYEGGRADVANFQSALQIVLSGGDNKDVEMHIPDGSGGFFTHAVRITAERDSEGKIIGALAFGRDITEHKRAEEALRESEQKFRSFIEESSEGFTLTDEQGTIIEWNRAREKITGLPKSEVLGKALWDIIYQMLTPELKTPERFEYNKQIILDALNTGKSHLFDKVLESEIIRQNDLQQFLEQTIFPIKTDKGYCLGSVTRDITKRKQMEETLAEREREFRSLAENSPDNIIRYNHQCRAIYCNKKIFTTNPEIILGKTPVELGVGGAENDAKYEEHIKQVLESGKSSELELVLQLTNGEFKNHLIRFVPERNIEGKITGVLSIGQDITERKQAEEEIIKLNTELEQRVFERTAQLEAANKELEAFAYSVSHDLRAPLRHIDGFLKLLQEKIQTKLDEQSIHYMITISNSAKKMGTLIDNLLSFSRVGRSIMSRTNVNLNQLIQEIIKDLQPETQGRNINWHISELPVVVGDKALLQAVLVNLISNALKFSRTRELAEIEIGSLPGEEKEEVVFVRDNGVGFDMNYATKLFGVFQRLHHSDEFEGTGIGLANVQRIIFRHGGRTWATGKVNEGATFYFSLPSPDYEK